MQQLRVTQGVNEIAEALQMMRRAAEPLIAAIRRAGAPQRKSGARTRHPPLPSKSRCRSGRVQTRARRVIFVNGGAAARETPD